MKESVLDVLMYLFQNYMGDDTDFHPDRESMHTELLEAGFPSHEVGQAFKWLDDLDTRMETSAILLNSERSFRIYTEEETAKLDIDCQGCLLYLEQAGILNSETRELVIDRVMALESEEMDLGQLKWIILMVLFNHPSQEEAYACMEDMLFADLPAYLH